MSIESSTNLPSPQICMYGTYDVEQDEDKLAVLALKLEFDNNEHLTDHHKAAIKKVLEQQRLSFDDLKDFYLGIVQHDKTKSSTLTSTSPDPLPLPGALKLTQVKAHKEDKLLENIMKQKSLSDVMTTLNAHISKNATEVASVTKKNQIVNTVLKLRLSEIATHEIIEKVFSFQESDDIYPMARDVQVPGSSPSPVDYMFAQKRSADFIKLYLDRLDKRQININDDQLMFTIMGAEHLTIDEKNELAKKVIASQYLEGLALISSENVTGNKVFHRSVVLADQQITGMLIKKKEVNALFYSPNKQDKAAHQIWREHQIQLQKQRGTPV